MRRRMPSLAAAALLALASSSALAAARDLPPPDQANLTRTSADYRIGPQDVLDVNVSQVQDLSRTVTVDQSGHILLPLIGQIQAAGRTPAELSDDIAVALKKKYMKDPQVLVSIKEAQGEKVTIDGAVTQPGQYQLAGPTTLMQAVSLAKGPDPKLANIHKVGVFRTVGGVRKGAVYDLAQIREGRAEDPRIYGSDIIVVETSGGKSFLQNFQGTFGLLGMLLRPW